MNQPKQFNEAATDRATTDSTTIAVASSVVGWSMDASAAAAVDSVSVGTSSGAKASKPARRGLNRVAPRTDKKSIRRREKLTKLRRKNAASSGLSAAAGGKTASHGSLPAKNLTPPAVEVPFSATSATTSVANAQNVKTDAVRSEVVAEIASLVSRELRKAPDSRNADSNSALVDDSKFGSQDGLPTSSPKFESRTKPNASPEKSATTRSRPTRRAKSGASNSKAAGFSVCEPAPIEEERYVDWLRRVVLKHRWMSFLTTFYVHWLLLLALTTLLVHGPEDTVNLLLNASFASENLPEEPTFEVAVPEPVPLETSVEDKPDPAADDPSTLSESQLELDESVLNELTPKSDASSANPETDSEQSDAATQPVNKAIDRSPPQAVSKGSFSVWTEPSSPQAGEPYRIIIQICLPDGMQKYNVADLQGVVVGSDGYRKPVPGYLRGFLPVEDGYARLIVPIVTAEEKVQDTIFIRSRILKETQKLQLVFEGN